jgi:hypothetical protein
MNAWSIIKLSFLRVLFKNRNYGVFGVIESGGAIVDRIASYKEDRFIDGKRSFTKPSNDKIYRRDGAPFTLFRENDAEAVDLRSADPVLDIRHPGKLHAFCEVYTAKAIATARRNNQFDPRMVVMILLVVAALGGVTLYFVFNTNDMLTRIANAGVEVAKDDLGKIFSGGK